MLVDPEQFTALKARPEDLTDPESDSVRFCRLGSSWRPRIDSIGKELPFEQGNAIIL